MSEFPRCKRKLTEQNPATLFGCRACDAFGFLMGLAGLHPELPGTPVGRSPAAPAWDVPSPSKPKAGRRWRVQGQILPHGAVGALPLTAEGDTPMEAIHALFDHAHEQVGTGAFMMVVRAVQTVTCGSAYSSNLLHQEAVRAEVQTCLEWRLGLENACRSEAAGEGG